MKKNAFWFCGSQRSWCKGNDATSKNPQKTLFDGEVLTLEILQAGESDITEESGYGSQYICCKGTSSKKGEFVENKTYTKRLSPGTCTQIWDACADEDIVASGDKKHLIKDCTTPDSDSCGNGKEFRNNECVAPCGNDKAFESATSNTCVSCPDETYRGINDLGVCRTCDKTREFFDSKNRRACKDLTESENKYSAQQMKACWRCSNVSSAFKDCMAQFASGGLSAVKTYIDDANHGCLK